MKKRYYVVILIVLACGALGAGAWYYNEYSRQSAAFDDLQSDVRGFELDKPSDLDHVMTRRRQIKLWRDEILLYMKLVPAERKNALWARMDALDKSYEQWEVEAKKAIANPQPGPLNGT